MDCTDYSKNKLYVGCGLTLASEAFKEEVEQTKWHLGTYGWEVMEFLGLTAGSAADVYQTDIVENVGGCDAFIAIVDEPSIGLGWELAVAANAEKPILATAHVDSKVSRMVLGAAECLPNMTFVRYEDMIADVPELAWNILMRGQQNFTLPK